MRRGYPTLLLESNTYLKLINMNKSKKIPYIDIKNYLHNELGLNKEEVIGFAKAYIDRHTQEAISDLTEHSRFEKILVNRVAQILTKSISSGADNMWIEKVVEKVVKEQLINRIDFDKLNIPFKKDVEAHIG